MKTIRFMCGIRKIHFYICGMSFSTFIVLIIIGLLAGMLSGFVGVGGGLLMIPLLMMFLSLSQLEAQGTAIVAMLPPIGILAAINYFKSGYVKWEYAVIIALTFVVGGYFGSKISLNLNPEIVKKVFGVIMLFAAIKLIFTK